MKLKIVKGIKYNEIKKALKQTSGQCPCVPKYAQTEDTVCMCKEFKEQLTVGECHCGMFEKIEE